MHTLSFQAPEELYEQLEQCAKRLDRSKAYVIRSALQEYLQDMNDAIEARRVQAGYRKEELIPFEEIKRQNNIE